MYKCAAMQVLVDLQRGKTALHAGSVDDGVDGVHDLGAAAVIDGQVDEQAAVGGGGVDYGVQFAPHVGRQRIQPADSLQPDIVLLQFGQFFAQIKAQQAPKGFDFGAGALPVLDRERIKGEDADAQAGAGFHGGAHRPDSGLVSGDARQAAAGGPATVAIHDNGDVRR